MLHLVLAPAWMPTLSHAVLLVSGFVEPVDGISSFVWCVGTHVGATDLAP